MIVVAKPMNLISLECKSAIAKERLEIIKIPNKGTNNNNNNI